MVAAQAALGGLVSVSDVRQIPVRGTHINRIYIYTSISSHTRKSTIFRKRYDSWPWPNYFWSRAEILVGSSGKVSFSNNHNFSGLGGDDYILYINHECMHVYGSNGCSLLAARLCSFFGTPAPTSDALCDFAGWVLLANSVCCLAGLRRCDLAQQFLSKSSLKITWAVLSLAGVFAQRAFADQVV